MTGFEITEEEFEEMEQAERQKHDDMLKELKEKEMRNINKILSDYLNKSGN